MLKKYKSVLMIFFGVNFYLAIAFIFNAAAANTIALDGASDVGSQLVSQNNMVQSQDSIITTDIDKTVAEIIDNHKLSKPIEEITISDIVRDENVNPEVKERIMQLINQSQYQMDRYRSAINNHYKQVENKLIAYRKELNEIYNFKDEMEANLNLSKWMIISLSIGIICLTTIVVIMWRSVVNVNRNDVEVLFSTEKVKKDIRLLSKRLEILETACKKDGKQ